VVNAGLRTRAGVAVITLRVLVAAVTDWGVDAGPGRAAVRGAHVFVITVEGCPRDTCVVNAGLCAGAGVAVVTLRVLVAAVTDWGVDAGSSRAAVRGAHVFIITAEGGPGDTCVVNAGLCAGAGVAVVTLGVLVAAVFDRGVHTLPSLAAVGRAGVFIITVDGDPRDTAGGTIAGFYAVTWVVVVAEIFVGQVVAVVIGAIADLFCRNSCGAWAEACVRALSCSFAGAEAVGGGARGGQDECLGDLRAVTEAVFIEALVGGGATV
jgi:hypothetical protein